jgi:hypothetical protein
MLRIEQVLGDLRLLHNSQLRVRQRLEAVASSTN